MKYILSLILFISVYVQAEDFDPILQSAYEEVINGQWGKSEEILNSYKTQNAGFYLVNSLWHGAENNPAYNKSVSTKYLEKSYSLGSREAQLVLIGVYLFSEAYPHSNYHRGMTLASDLMEYYEHKIAQGQDPEGELHRIVGKFYLLGIGVEKDASKGTKLVKLAAKLGDTEAIGMFSE